MLIFPLGSHGDKEDKMNFRHIFIFLGFALLSFLNCKNSTMIMIKQFGKNSCCDSKGYIKTPKMLRKMFKVKYYAIPKYLCFELYMAVFFALLGPINLIISSITRYNKEIVGILIMFHCCLGLCNMIYFVVLSSFYERWTKVKKTRKKTR